MREQGENKARANLELASALKAARRHEGHRTRTGKACPWCDAAEKRLAEARAAVARLTGPEAA